MTSCKMMTYLVTLMCALCCCMVTWCEGIRSDVFLSTAETSELLASEKGLLTFVHHCLTQTATSTGNTAFNRLAGELQSELDAIPQSQDAKHPVDAYVGLRRFTRYWAKYISVLAPVVAHSVERSLAENRLVYPDHQVLHHARLAIVRLQAAYHLNTSSLLNSAHVNLSAEDAASMAMEAQLSGFPALAEDWKHLASSLFPSEQDIPLDESLAWKRSSENDREAEETHAIRRRYAQFFSLCRHFQDSHDVTVLRSERCEYSAGSMPLYRWKREVLSTDPYVALLYDFVTDWEADFIVSKAMNRLTQAHTGFAPDKSILQTQRRLGKIAWLRGAGSTVLSRITRRIQDVTGLHTAFRPVASFGEDFQVVNYGIGGHYIPHYDFFRVKNAFSAADMYLRDSGDRAATFMIYLGNVTRGGATVFPHLGIGAPPVKNAALFWYNFDPDGIPDPRSQHGGCPVVIGEKWVTNKWIHEISTAMSKTCQTSPWKSYNT